MELLEDLLEYGVEPDGDQKIITTAWYEPGRALAITRDYNLDYKAKRVYLIYHVKSGRAVMPTHGFFGFKTMAQAEYALEQLLTLKVDWQSEFPNVAPQRARLFGIFSDALGMELKK